MKFSAGYIFRQNKAIGWIQSKLKPKQFIIVAAIFVGLTAGFAAVLLKQFVHLLQRNIEGLSVERQIFVAAFPAVGIALCVLFNRYINRNRSGQGLSNIFFSIARRSSVLPKDLTYAPVVTSGLTIGFGGSAGVESPIVTAGAAIGSNFGRTYRLTYKERTLLLACGAAAGIAGAFNTPIAGVLFALEALLIEAGISAFIPILIAAAAGALCSKIILHEEILLHFSLREPFDYSNVPFYMLLGIVCGLVSYYYSAVYLRCERFFSGYKINGWMRVLVGGAGLYVMVLLFPPLFGEGYESIRQISDLKTGGLFQSSPLQFLHLSRPGLYLMLLAVVMLKPVATAFTLGGGGNGGNFASSLVTGAFLGFLVASSISELGFIQLPVSNFALIAMAGILSGIFHAPLTGIFIIAEVTGGYELIIPLMIVSALSYAVSKYFMPLSIDKQKLAENENIVATDTDSYLLTHIGLSQFVENDFREIYVDGTMKEIVEAVAASKRNIFPVIDKESVLAGIITIDDIREKMFKPELYETVRVKDVMRPLKYVISEKDDLRSAMRLFDESQLWNIPVVENGVYRGFLSKSTILEKYREALIKSSIE